MYCILSKIPPTLLYMYTNTYTVDRYHYYIYIILYYIIYYILYIIYIYYIIYIIYITALWAKPLLIGELSIKFANFTELFIKYPIQLML